jgi:hypothetical protein
MFYSSAVIGSDDVLYVPFFGLWDYYPSGGIQAIGAAGEPRWFFASRETEAQSPLVARDRATGDTVIVFGSAGRPYGNVLLPDSHAPLPRDDGHLRQSPLAAAASTATRPRASANSCVSAELWSPYDARAPTNAAHCHGRPRVGSGDLRARSTPRARPGC